MEAWKRFRLLLVLAAVVAALGTEAAAAGFVLGPISPDPRAGELTAQGNREVLWTEERLKSAKPMDLLRLPGRPVTEPALEGRTLRSQSSGERPQVLYSPGSQGRAAVPLEIGVPGDPGQDGSPPAGRPPWQCPASYYNQGLAAFTWDWPERTVGKLYFTTEDGTAVCSASVVGKDLIMTAGHCVATNGVWHTDFVFIPGFDTNWEPYGRWYGKQPATFSEWLESSSPLKDVAFITVHSGVCDQPFGAASVGEVVGYLGFMANVEPTTVTWENGAVWKQYGYPAASPYDGDKLIIVASGFGHKDYPERPDECCFTIGVGSDMTGGSSGGPWLFPSGPTVYTVNGLISYGYSSCDETVYGPYFDTEVWELFQFMAAHQDE